MSLLSVELPVRELAAAEVQSRYNNGPEGEETLHYYLGEKEVALKRGGVVYWLHQDHLGGTAVVSNNFGDSVGSIAYLPYGETRTSSGTLGTDRKFTGQRLDGTGLYYYGARYYDPSIGRFISPDTFVQAGVRSPTAFLPLAVSYANPKSLEQWNELNRRGAGAGALTITDPQFLNRYTYARNNPLAYVDDSGNFAWFAAGGLIGAAAGFTAYAVTHRGNFSWTEATQWTVGGALIGMGAGFLVEVAPLAFAADAGTTMAAATPRGLSAFSRSAEFGIKSYDRLRQLTKGTGLEVHKLIEARFAKSLGIRAGDIPSIALTKAEHQVFTSAWRDAIAYINSVRTPNTGTATIEAVWFAAQRVYADHPDLLEAIQVFLFN